MTEKLTLNGKAPIRYSELRHQFVIGIQDFFSIILAADLQGTDEFRALILARGKGKVKLC